MCIPLAVAQDAILTPDALPIIEHCVTIDNSPPDDWTFKGTIITYEFLNGVYGFRSDFESRYYIAFDSNRQFALNGSVSPDGQWFVSYWGRRVYGNMMGYDYFASELVVTSTHPRRESYRIPFTDVTIVSQYPKFLPPIWLDNTQFVVENALIHPFEGIAQDLAAEEAAILREAAPEQRFVYDHQFVWMLDSLPADPPRAFALNMSNASGGLLYVTDLKTHQVYNTCIQLGDSRGGGLAYAISPSGDQVAVSIGGEDGFVYVFDLNDWTAYRLDLAANSVVAWAVDP